MKHGDILLISDQRAKSIIRRHLGVLPLDVDRSVYKNWAEVWLNPDDVRNQKRPQTRQGPYNELVVDWLVPLTGPWLLPFAIGINLPRIYELAPLRVSIHGIVYDELCAACDNDMICIADGRNDDPFNYDGCDGEGLHIIGRRKYARRQQQEVRSGSR